MLNPHEKAIEQLRTALGAVLGDIDYTKHACELTSMVGAALNPVSLELAQKAMADTRGIV